MLKNSITTLIQPARGYVERGVVGPSWQIGTEFSSPDALAHERGGLASSIDSVLNDVQRLADVQLAAQAAGSVQRVLDCLTTVATRALGAPIAVITLVDRDRQVLMSVAGLRNWWVSLGETPLEYSFCKHTVKTGAPLVITDTAGHPLAVGNPFVTELGVRAYAGAPMWSRHGRCLGAFAVLSLTPRDWTAAELDTLGDLAVAAGLEVARGVERTQPPGKGAAATRTTASQPTRSDSPRPVVQGSNVVLRTWKELHERRVLRVGLAYLAAAWLVIDVAGEVLPPLGLPPHAQTFIILFAALCLPLVLATAWAFDLTPAGIMRAEERQPDEATPVGDDGGRLE